MNRFPIQKGMMCSYFKCKLPTTKSESSKDPSPKTSTSDKIDKVKEEKSKKSVVRPA